MKILTLTLEVNTYEIIFHDQDELETRPTGERGQRVYKIVTTDPEYAEKVILGIHARDNPKVVDRIVEKVDYLITTKLEHF